MNNEHQQKKVALWSVVSVLVILALALFVAVCWYYLRGRKTNPEIPQTQGQLTIRDQGGFVCSDSESTKLRSCQENS